MIHEFTLYGLKLPELILFGIIIYLAALILVIICVHCNFFRVFCPSSADCLHCTHVNCRSACCNCSLRQNAKSIFCCKRNHSVYKPSCEFLPKYKLKCFSPDCNYLRCCCCEFFKEDDEKYESSEKPKTDHSMSV